MFDVTSSAHAYGNGNGNFSGFHGVVQWRSGESTRLPPMWPGFDSRCGRHMWVEFVVGSRPCFEGFSPGTPVFSSPQKSSFPNYNSTCKHFGQE